MRYFRVLTISLVLHIIAALVLSMVPAPRVDLRRPTYVELVERPELPRRPHQPPRDEKQFVRSVDLPDRMLSKEKKDARFASEEERYVLEEQRARMTDMTANRSHQETKSGRPREQSRMQARGKLDFKPKSPLDRAQEELRSQNSAGDVKVGGLSKPSRTDAGGNGAERSLNPAFGAEKGISTFGESVPDSIKFGDFTALNTDRHLYYTFYARMEEKIRFRWVTYARAAVYNMSVDPRHATGRDTWVTKLEVILDPRGRFVRAILHESSGVTSLDSAPVQAFRDAGQFPNPPPEMVKSDGTIHIFYAFNVNMGSGGLAGSD